MSVSLRRGAHFGFRPYIMEEVHFRPTGIANLGPVEPNVLLLYQNSISLGPCRLKCDLGVQNCYFASRLSTKAHVRIAKEG